MIDTTGVLEELGFFLPESVVLDIGCGPAMVPMYCVNHAKNIRYLGLDVKRNIIDNCKKLGLGPNYRFEQIDVYNPVYNFRGKQMPELMELPVEDVSCDSIICHSLFTHLDTEAIASRYMSEIDRVLKPGGLLWTSWFLFPPNLKSDGAIRTVYDRKFVGKLLDGYELLYSIGGDTDSYHDQWYVGVRK